VKVVDMALGAIPGMSCDLVLIDRDLPEADVFQVRPTDPRD
jgi:hypothetical protein